MCEAPLQTCAAPLTQPWHVATLHQAGHCHRCLILSQVGLRLMYLARNDASIFACCNVRGDMVHAIAAAIDVSASMAT